MFIVSELGYLFLSGPYWILKVVTMEKKEARSIFEFRYAEDCKKTKKPCQESKPGSYRILSIIKASLAYGNNLHSELQYQLQESQISILSLTGK